MIGRSYCELVGSFCAGLVRTSADLCQPCMGTNGCKIEDKILRSTRAILCQAEICARAIIRSSTRFWARAFRDVRATDHERLWAAQRLEPIITMSRARTSDQKMQKREGGAYCLTMAWTFALFVVPICVSRLTCSRCLR
jgi:hypothetical protein